MGMEFDRWTHKSCQADVAVGDNWATLYSIESKEKRKGHAEELLREIKKYYEGLGKDFGGDVALNKGMRKLYQKLNIKEYN